MATYTLETVEADLLEYADFEEVASVSRAKLFVTAANRFVILAPTSESNQSSAMSIDMEGVKETKRRALAFIRANADTSSGAQSGVNFLSVNHTFR